MTTQTAPPSSSRWLVFSGVTVALIILLLVLERPFSTLLMGSILAAFAGFLAWRLYQSVQALQPGQRIKASAPGQLISRHRIVTTHVLAVMGTVVLVLSGQQFEPAFSWENIPQATLLLVVGGVLLGGAIWLNQYTGLEMETPQISPVTAPAHALTLVHKLLAGSGVVCLALLAEYNGQLLKTGLVLSTHVQFGLWTGGIILLVSGLGGFTPRIPRVSWPALRQLLPLLAILLLALALRLWNMENSARFLVDELDFTRAVLALESETERPLLKPVSDIGGFSLLFPYVQFHTVHVFGHNFTGLRIASTVIGTLHVAALYALARQLFDRPTAIMAALLLATFPPHLHFSRLGLTELPGALCGAAGLAFLTRAVLHNRRGDYVLAGALLGMTHYFHEGGRLLYTPLAVTWLVGWWWLGKARFSLRGVGWMLLTLVLVALPNYYALYGLGFPLTNRLATGNVAIDSLYFEEINATGDPLRLLRERLLAPMLLFVHGTDGALFYLGTNALVLPLLVPLFLAGLWVVIWRWRQPGMMLLLIWLAATIVGNSLLLVSTSVARYVIVFAGIALVMAVGLRVITRLILPEPLLPRQPYQAILIGFAVTLAAAQMYYYFGEHIPDYNWQARDLWTHPDAQDAASRSVDFPNGTVIHVISSAAPATNYASGLLSFLAPDKDLLMKFLTPGEITPAYLAAQVVTVDHAFFIEPDDTTLPDVIRDYFYLLPPEYTPYPYIAPEAQFTLYYSPYIPGYSENRTRGPQTDTTTP